MTTRPSQHQIEDLSRAKFQLALPRQWVLRNKDKDYGIDCEVELFDNDKKAQGLVFYIQLKATESKEVKNILNVDIKIDTLRYYKKLEIPVLLVRYSEYQDTFYIKWLYNVDLFFSDKNAKTIRIKLNTDDKWHAKSSETIEKRLLYLRKINSGNFGFPIPYSIIIVEDKIKDFSSSLLKTKIKNRLNQYSEYLYYSNPENSILQIQLDNDELKTSICELGSCSFHSIGFIPDENFVCELCENILLGLSSCLYQIGQIENCGRIIFSNNLGDKLITKKELLIYLINPLFQTSYFENILELIENMVENESLIEAEIIALTNVLIKSKTNNESKINRIERFLKKRLEKSINNKDNLQIGISHYNLGNHFRGRGLTFKSFHHYVLAKRFAPIYKLQPYFFSELAGVLFLSNKFHFSSIFYHKSLKIEDSFHIKARYADALMFSGEYEKANEVFKEYIVSNDKISEEFNLKAICLGHIVDEMGVKNKEDKFKKLII